MRIKTQLIMSMVVLGIVFVIISASVISTNQQIDRMNRQEDLANNIVRGSYELSHLSNDYLLNQENRQLTQWKSKFSSFSDNLAQLNPSTPEQQTLVDNIRTNQRRLNDVFSQVVSTIESPNDTQSKSADSEFIQVSWSRIGVQNQGIIFDASRLAQISRNESDKLQHNNTLLTYASLAILLLVLLFNFAFTSRRILRSLSNLQEGTQIIGSGNLDYAIDENSKDEIGDLSHAFNQMSLNLKGVTASKADLEKEIDERKRAEEALRETTGYLQNLFDYANAPIIMWDPGLRITRFNPALERLTGRSHEVVLGKTLDILFPGESRQASMALIRQMFWILKGNLLQRSHRVLISPTAKGQNNPQKKVWSYIRLCQNLQKISFSSVILREIYIILTRMAQRYSGSVLMTLLGRLLNRHFLLKLQGSREGNWTWSWNQKNRSLLKLIFSSQKLICGWMSS
jgi:PAS domain S-box-containing protein